MLSAKASGSIENRHRYQGNEYVEDNELRWMDFHARQYDPQIGRFLGIDPLAYAGGQQVYSPYAAMGNSPGMYIDPNGERFSPYDEGTADESISHGGLDAVGFRLLGELTRSGEFQANPMFGVNVNNTLMATGMGGGGLWGMRGLNYAMDLAIGKLFWDKVKDYSERGVIKQSSVAPDGSVIISYEYQRGYIDPETGEEGVGIDLVRGTLRLYPSSRIGAYTPQRSGRKFKGNGYDGWEPELGVLGNASAWLNNIMMDNWMGDAFGSNYAWTNQSGWDNYGYPTMKYTWGTMGTIFTGGPLLLETSALAHTSIMGTTTTKQVGTWIYNGFSFGVGTYNTYAPNNTWGNEIGKGVDIYDFYKYRNPFSLMNYGFRGIDYYESLKKK